MKNQCIIYTINKVNSYWLVFIFPSRHPQTRPTGEMTLQFLFPGDTSMSTNYRLSAYSQFQFKLFLDLSVFIIMHAIHLLFLLLEFSE